MFDINAYFKNSVLITCALLVTPVIQAETAEDKGLAIAKEFDQRDLGFSDSTAEMTMTLRNKQGDETSRLIRIKTLEVQGDGDKSLSIFDTPADIKGTAMLTFSHKLDPDDQWLYLPALKRVKRISSRNKSGPFMGSEFAFEDLGSQEIEKYNYKYLRDEVIDGLDCFVVERLPQYKHSGYTRQEAWYDKKEYRLIKIVFYDRKNSLLKTLQYSNHKKYLDKHWRAEKMHVENHQTSKSTTLLWKNYKFKTGLSDRDFDKSTLKRVR
ncbi:MAG: outer membrane lipoprotein-sorting protein [Gammaproteobacteria bacterium]|nr:outer membrane lipoprotein-sorting protein [Gammaproteobacteria bacterium]